VISNYEFVIGNNEELTQIQIDEISSVYNTGMPNRWFIPIKPNVINNLELDSPFGISIFANSIDVIKSLDLSYDSLVNEIQNGRKRLFVTADAMKVSSDGCFKNSFDPSDVVFYILDKGFNAKDSGYVQEVNGQLRIDEITKAIQMNLNLLSMKLGLGDNYFKFDGNTVTRTATEVISENSDLYRTIQKHKIVLESAIRELIKTISVISGINTENITIDFDDSIIESKEQERLQDRQDMAIDVLSRIEYRMKWYGEDKETATQKIAEVDSEKQENSSIHFYEGDLN
jgi:A118 family predicted phage portal protein